MQRLNVKNIIKLMEDSTNEFPPQATNVKNIIIIKSIKDDMGEDPAQALNRIDEQSNTSLWVYLLDYLKLFKTTYRYGAENYVFFLFGLGLWPTAEALSACDKKTNVNLWFRFSGWRGIYIALFGKGIFPTAKDLAVSDGHHNGWSQVVGWGWGFSALLDHGVIPDHYDLSSPFSWRSMADDKPYYYNMHRLMTLDILPPSIADLPLDMKEWLKPPYLPKMEYKRFCKRQRNLLWQYRYKMPNNDHLLPRLLSRHDVADFYGAIYLLYFLQTRRDMSGSSYWPLEIFLQICLYALPQSVNADNISELLSETNKFAFVKHHAIHSYLRYYRKWGSFSHGDRAYSLAENLAYCRDRNEMQSLLDAQYVMSRYPGKSKYDYYCHPSIVFPKVLKYKKPYAKNVEKDTFDQDFKHLIKEVNITCRLNKKM